MSRKKIWFTKREGLLVICYLLLDFKDGYKYIILDNTSQLNSNYDWIPLVQIEISLSHLIVERIQSAKAVR